MADRKRSQEPAVPFALVPMANQRRGEPGEPTPLESSSILARVHMPTESARVALTSGRTYELSAGNDADEIVIRGRDGGVIIDVRITDRGPVFRCTGAELTVKATDLRLAARRIAIEADDELALRSSGSLEVDVTSDAHSRVGGTQRQEATALEIQSATDIGVRAEGRVAVDADRIGLNDDVEPKPFAWSTVVGGTKS